MRKYFPLKIARRVKGVEYSTVLFCTKGFCQIKFIFIQNIHEEDFLVQECRSFLEVFQQVLASLLDNIENIENSLDAIFIMTETKDKLNEITEKVIKTLLEARFKLNKDKSVFSQQGVTFLGPVFTEQVFLCRR